MKHFSALLLFALTLLPADHFPVTPEVKLSSDTRMVRITDWQIALERSLPGTDPDFRNLTWQGFQTGTMNDSKYDTGNWILQASVEVTDSIMPGSVFCLFPFQFITAYEIYWDGIRIGQNGKTGKRKGEEVPGSSGYYVVLAPDQISKGRHVIHIRLTNYHDDSSWKWYYGELILGRYDLMMKGMSQKAYLAIFVSGILFIAFLFNLFLFFTRQRRTEHLLFSTLCLLIIFDFMVYLAPTFHEVQTTFIHFENYFYHLNTLLLTILFPVYFVYSFGLRKVIMPVVATINTILMLFFTDIWTLFSVMSVCVLIELSLILSWAVWLKRDGSIVLFVGLLLSWIAYFFGFVFEGLATIMVIITSFTIARQFAREEVAGKESQLRTVRLENELLKKNINPHFVLNTLTSILAWLRRDTGTAVKLIESLAEEFRMINQISSLKLIPLSQEVELCRSHLRIMSYRKDAEYTLKVIDADTDALVPPMVFHTLIENGLTHGYEKKTTGIFTLQLHRTPGSIVYTLSNDGVFNPEDTKGSTGFGSKYIRARLEESYPGRWTFQSHQTEIGWESIIEIREQK